MTGRNAIKGWFPKPLAGKCCVGYPRECGAPSIAAYPAMGGGYAELCEKHAPPHANYTQTVEEIRAGIPHHWHSPPTTEKPE